MSATDCGSSPFPESSCEGNIAIAIDGETNGESLEHTICRLDLIFIQLTTQDIQTEKRESLPS